MWLFGTGVIEYKSTVGRSCGSPHFHLMLNFPSTGKRSLAAVDRALKRGADRLRFPTCRAERPFGGPISGPDFVDVQTIYAISGLAVYVTKETGKGNGALDGKNIFFVGAKGIEGLIT